MKLFNFEFNSRALPSTHNNFFFQNKDSNKTYEDEINIDNCIVTRNDQTKNNSNSLEKLLSHYNRHSIKNDLSILNQTKVYLIVKDIEIEDKNRTLEGKEGGLIGILPISNYDRLVDHEISRLILHRDVSLMGIFTDEMNESEQRNSANRCFLLEGLITPGPSNDGVLKPSIKELDIKEKMQVLIVWEDEAFLIEFPDDEEEEKRRFLGLDEYEYIEGEIDTMQTNPQKYFSPQKKIDAYQNEEDNLAILPVFLDFETAQNFLKITFQELLCPYKKKKAFTTNEDLSFFSENFRIFEGDYETLTNTSRFITAVGSDKKIYNARNIDYLDDQVSFVNKISPFTWANRITNWLAEHRWIKPSQYKGGYYRKSFVPEVNKILLNSIIDTKIVSVGLGDFLMMYKEQLNNIEDLRNTELLFIPSEKEFYKQSKFLKSARFDLKNDISANALFNYQKKFYEQFRIFRNRDFEYTIGFENENSK